MRRIFTKSLILGLAFLLSHRQLVAQDPQFRKTPFVVQLTAPLSTKTAQKHQKVTAQVTSPAEYSHWFMTGEVDNVNNSGSFSKKSELRFSFKHLVNADNTVNIPVSATIGSFVNSKGQQSTDEEGQIVEKKNPTGKAALIGTLAGAGLGAALGGAQGAAIGAGAGAGVGLLIAAFGVKGPSISFDAGSQFNLIVNNRQEASSR